MTKQEFGRLVAVIRGVYRDDKFLANNESAQVWYELLKDIDYEQAKAAVIKHSLTSKWTPTIAELREQIADIQADKSDWSDGWQEVLIAVRKFGYMNESEAMEWMSPMTREVTKRLGWKQICQSDISEITALRANFRMIYEQKQNAIKEEKQLPEGFHEVVKQLNNSMKLID